MLSLFPDNTKELIQEMISMDGRVVTFYLPTAPSGCPICSLDPITNTSVDSFCPVCSGAYWIYTHSGWDVVAHVTWGRSEDRDWQTGGMLDNGDCTVKFIYSGYMQEIIDDAEYVVVDDRTMDIQRTTLRGVPVVNRVIVHLKEKEK